MQAIMINVEANKEVLQVDNKKGHRPLLGKVEAMPF